tara:strand:+ start:263 stop:679 length:417 start_codon:yes stop_codon:yes gene_type:complete
MTSTTILSSMANDLKSFIDSAYQADCEELAKEICKHLNREDAIDEIINTYCKKNIDINNTNINKKTENTLVVNPEHIIRKKNKLPRKGEPLLRYNLYEDKMTVCDAYKLNYKDKKGKTISIKKTHIKYDIEQDYIYLE